MSTLLSIQDSILEKLVYYFSELEDGRDISPAKRYRLEGYLQACVEYGGVDESWLRDCVSSSQQSALNFASTNLTGHEHSWELPYKMVKAPVVPTTKKS